MVDSFIVRAAILSAVAVATCACANEPLAGSTIAPMMMLGPPATVAAEVKMAAAPTADDDISKKSLAAKVLASRALEAVTGLKTDPARLSEHD